MTTSPIGNKIKEYRQARGLSRQKLAEDTGLSSVAIWKLETGKNSPNTTTLQRIAQSLNIPVALFFD